MEDRSSVSMPRFLPLVLFLAVLACDGPAQAQTGTPPQYENPIWKMQRDMGITPGSQTAEEFTKMQAQRQAEQQKAEDAWWAGMLAKITAPAAPSPWLEKERKLFNDAIGMAKPTVLVVPPTVPEGAPGIDISARITIGRQIARAIEADVGEIPDPALVYRALGEPRAISVDELRQRFALGSAEWLVAGTAQHDGAGRMRVTLTKIRLYGRTEGAPPVFDRAGIEFSDARTPELQFAPLAAAAARALGYSGAQPPPPAAAKRAALALSKSPAEVPDETNTLGGVWRQQLLGVLHTPYLHALPRPRERVFERTLAALIDSPRGAPDRAVLLARALAYLDRRQAALKVLAEGAGTPEEKALRAYLMSDLPGLTAAVAQLERPAARLVSQIELVTLRKFAGALSQQDMRSELDSIAASLPKGWRAAAAFHVLGMDLWTLPPAASVKPVLDLEFPVAGYSAEDLVRGKAALGTRSYDESTAAMLELSPLVHAQKWRAEHLKEVCCGTGSVSWGRYRREQYLDLLEADADRLATAKIAFLRDVQGDGTRAERLASLYDNVLFAGSHPGVIFQRLLLTHNVAGAAQDQRARLGIEAFEHARRLLTWETAQSGPLSMAAQARDSLFQYYVRTQEARERPLRTLPPLGLESDLPMRALWAQRIGESNLRPDDFALEASRSACDNTMLMFQACADYLNKLRSVGRSAALDGALASLVEPRFKGYGRRYEVLAQRKEETGDPGAARALLEEAVRLPDAPASTYASLGRVLQAQGRFSDASRAYLSYPGLKTGKENVVGLSNYTGQAGLSLARHGAPAEGRPLLELAAANHDGSFLSLRSAAQVTQASGDFGGSLAILRQAYQRYGGPETAALIASTLFMLGQPENAWGALRDVLPEAKGFAPYRAAVLGLRMGAYDDDALLNWRIETLQRSNANPAMRSMIINDLAVIALFQAAADRDGAGLNSIFDIRRLGNVMVRAPAQAGLQAGAANVSLPIGYFITAYAAFRKGDHKSAAEAWDILVKQYDYNAVPSRVGEDPGMFWGAMPYAALSLARLGRADEAARLPERLTPAGRPAGSPRAFPGAAAWRMPDFDRKMIAGIAAAFSGKHAEAQQHFRGAQGTMEASGARVLPPEYAFVEILETAAKETGVAAYKDIALAFARGYQGFEPWSGWAYAFEAENSPRGEGQIRALALALKFDPRSSRIAKLDPKLVEQAREWLRTNDPFIVRTSPAAEKTRL